MLTLLHDGTFTGRLCAVARALELDQPIQLAVVSDERTGSLLDVEELVVSDETRAGVLLADATRRISGVARRHIFHVMYAERKALDAFLGEYLRLGFRMGAKVDSCNTQSGVRELLAASQRVAAEINRLKCLLRFSRLASGVCWAPVAPLANVILPVAFHFRRRFGAERWGIQDVQRGLAMFWDGRELTAHAGPEYEAVLTQWCPAELAPDEREYRDLWRTFFRSSAIPPRCNPGLPHANMPRYYWKYLTGL